MESTGTSMVIEEALIRDLGDPAFKANPYPTYDVLRREPGWRSPAGYRVFARYNDVHEILRQPTVFGQITRPEPSFHVMDPPDHTRLRGLVSRAFTPRSISARDEMITEVATDLLLELKDAGRMEFVSEYAGPFPGRVIARILGVPYENGDRWNDWLNAVRASRGVVRYLVFDPEEVEEKAVTARSEGRKTADHLRRVMEERRSSLGDDIISRLITARDGDDALTEDEVLFTLVLSAGGRTSHDDLPVRNHPVCPVEAPSPDTGDPIGSDPDHERRRGGIALRRSSSGGAPAGQRRRDPCRGGPEGGRTAHDRGRRGQSRPGDIRRP